MAWKLYQVTKPFRWAARDYVPGELIELPSRSHTRLARHPTLAGKVVLLGDLKGQTSHKADQKSLIARQRKTLD